MFSKNNLNKKAQVGKTVTWLVATVIIIIILLASTFITTLGPQGSKKMGSRNFVDPLASKSFFSYLLTEDEGGVRIYEQIKEEENLNEFNGDLALDIFDGFYSEDHSDAYGKDYQGIWLGIVPIKIISYSSNDYFGSRTSVIGDIGEFRLRREILGAGLIAVITEGVYLDEEKGVELILDKED